MTIRAKFFVSEMKLVGTPGNDPFTIITLSPVFDTYGDSNDKSMYIPSGKFEMSVINPSAIEQFSIGKAY